MNGQPRLRLKPHALPRPKPPHPHGHTQIESLPHTCARRKTGTIDFRPRSPSGAEPEGARDRVRTGTPRLGGKIPSEQSYGASFELSRVSPDLRAEFGAQSPSEVFNRAPKPLSCIFGATEGRRGIESAGLMRCTANSIPTAPTNHPICFE